MVGNVFQSQCRNCFFVCNAEIRDFVVVVVVELFIMSNPWDGSWWICCDFANQFRFISCLLTDLWTLCRHGWTETDFEQDALRDRFADAIARFTDVSTTVFLLYLEDREVCSTGSLWLLSAPSLPETIFSTCNCFPSRRKSLRCHASRRFRALENHQLYTTMLPIVPQKHVRLCPWHPWLLVDEWPGGQLPLQWLFPNRS